MFLVYDLNPVLTPLFPFIKLAVATTALRQVGRPVAAGSCRLDRYVTGHFHGPKAWVKTSFVFGLVSPKLGA